MSYWEGRSLEPKEKRDLNYEVMQTLGEYDTIKKLKSHIVRGLIGQSGASFFLTFLIDKTIELRTIEMAKQIEDYVLTSFVAKQFKENAGRSVSAKKIHKAYVEYCENIKEEIRYSELVDFNRALRGKYTWHIKDVYRASAEAVFIVFCENEKNI